MEQLDIWSIALLLLPVPFQFYIITDLFTRKKQTILCLWAVATAGHLICLLVFVGGINMFFNMKMALKVLSEQLNLYVFVISFINTQILNAYRTLFSNFKLSWIIWLRVSIFVGYVPRLAFSLIARNYLPIGLEKETSNVLFDIDLAVTYSWLFGCVMYDNIQCIYLTYMIYRFKKKSGVANLYREFRLLQSFSIFLVLLDWLGLGLNVYYSFDLDSPTFTQILCLTIASFRMIAQNYLVKRLIELTRRQKKVSVLNSIPNDPINMIEATSTVSLGNE